MERWYKNGIVFNSQQAIRLDNANTSLPHFLTDEFIRTLGYVKVVEVSSPTITNLQVYNEGAVELINGIPTGTWVVSDKFSDTTEYTTIDGTVVPAKTKLQNETEYLAKLQADTIASMVQHFTDVTTTYIEGKVQEYNAANGLAFKDIDAFTKYAVTPTSTHNAIAIQFISYADRIWNAARAYQATATTIPTDSEFIAVLDGVVF